MGGGSGVEQRTRRTHGGLQYQLDHSCYRRHRVNPD
jgi:hypothetical protein